MAEKNYTLEQAAAKVGKTPEEFKELAKQNGISELREGSKILYNAKEIDAIAASGADDTVLNIEDSVIGLSDESSLLGLAPVDDASDEDDELEIDADMSSMVELTEADTRAGLDDAEEDDSIISLADSMPEESTAGSEAKIDADADIDSASADGSGSGLLDLSLQADDSQFGAVLDDILPGGDDEPDAFADFNDEVPSSGDAIAQAAAADESDEEPVAVTEESFDNPSQPAYAATQSSQESFAPTAVAPAAAYQYAEDPASGIFGVAMLLPLVALIFTAIVLVSGFNAVTPSLLYPIADYLMYIVGGIAALALIIAIIGAVSGSDKTPKAAKPKKEKKAKKAKKKK